MLAGKKYASQAFLIGFSTRTGTVTAASDWGAPTERKRVRQPLPESYEALFHETRVPAFLLNLRESHPAVTRLRQRRLERAIGVSYRPEI